MKFIDKLVCPTPPNLAKEREVIVLKQEDRDSLFFVKHAHLAHNFRRFACANNSARSGSIERVNRTEGTSAGTTAAGKNGHDASAENHFWFVVAIWIRQLIEIIEKRARLCRNNLFAVPVSNPMHAAPFKILTDGVDEFEQRTLSFKPNDAVQFGNQFQSLLIT